MPVHYYLDLRTQYPATRPVSVVLFVRRNRLHKLKVTTPVRVAPRDWSKNRERLKPSTPGAVAMVFTGKRGLRENNLMGHRIGLTNIII